MKSIEKLWQPEHIPVQPVGTLKSHGWTPGTYVRYVDSSVDPSYHLAHGALAMVDVWSSRKGAAGELPNRPAGFLWHGVQKPSSFIEGDEKYYLTAKEPNDIFGRDNDGLLSFQGTGVATMVIASTGMFRTYIFEQRDSVGTALVYHAGDILYVSDNYIFTKEIFTDSGNTGYWSGYQVAGTGHDDTGDYLIITNSY